ncbi:MAG: 50S ribosomal protein L10 [Gammaproteobacteria bacterium]|nr:50S ribosomal protein L10 [Gammaproteobacteria bacterium]
MPMTRERKEALVEDMHALASQSSALLLADYRGLDVAAMTDMRVRARAQDIELKVVPNRLAKLAFSNTPHACLEVSLKGPSLLASTRDDAGALARLMRDIVKEHESMAVRAISVDGHLVPGEELSSLANMPTRDQALAQLIGVLNAPIAKLAQTLSAVPQKVVLALSAYATVNKE